ncbi:MAG TPA: hypothetical protein VFD59_19600 [Nocardioidaceae bacterium]|nr:hypothetical protein [Nocardioidaceae bacterium]
MARRRDETAPAAPVETFKPTTGIFAGWVGLLLVAMGVGYVVVAVHTATGVRVALGLAFFGVVIWVTQLRSRAAAYPHTLVLKNSLVDTHVPLRLIDEVSASRTLNVWVGESRYVCIGIGRSLRSMLRGSETAGSRPDERATTYETFVLNRIEELVERAKGERERADDLRVRRSYAWPEILGLVLAAAAFLISLWF